mmetsp:Transcript_31404/g.100902  ORF Transcript_31404/g.100902 Transcript_31404/m.100902 type:complete len:536 (-) Transcript_31404:564-2171(-)
MYSLVFITSIWSAAPFDCWPLIRSAVPTQGPRGRRAILKRNEGKRQRGFVRNVAQKLESKVGDADKLSSSVTRARAELVPNASAVKLTIPVSGATTKAAFKASAKELAKTHVIPGWRKKDFAKIPAGVVARTVGPEVVKAKAIETLSEVETRAAITALGVKAVGQARLLSTPTELSGKFDPGKDWELQVQIDIWPEEPKWSVPYFEPFAIQIERSESEHRLRQDAMTALRERYARIEGVDRVAALGDSCLVDVAAFERRETNEKGNPLEVSVGGESLEIILEDGKFLPGVVEALVGQKAGTVVDIPVDMPTQLRRQPLLAGKQLMLEVKLKSVRRRAVPSPEELANDMNATLDAIERKIDDTLFTAQQQQQQQQQKNDLNVSDRVSAVSINDEIEKVLADRVAETPLPPDMVVEVAKQKFAVMLADMRSRGTPDTELKEMISPGGFDKYRTVIQPSVERELRAKLAVQHIAKDQNIQVSQEEIDEQLKVVKVQYKASKIDEEKAIERIINELTRLKVCDYLLNNVAAIAFETASD